MGTPAQADAAEDRFVDEYLACGCNATQAYLRTHPRSAPGSARANAVRMMTKDSVRRKLRAARRRLRNATGVKAEEVVAELAKIAFADFGDVFDFGGREIRTRRADQILPSARQALASLELPNGVGGPVKARFHDKTKALEHLARMLGLFDDPPPLEHVLAALPPVVAAAVRRAVASALRARAKV